MKLDIKKQTNKHIYNNYSGLTIRDAAPESHQLRPESLEGLLQPASSKVKHENDVIRNRISDFDKRRISQPKIQ